MSEILKSIWNGCYDEGWGDLIVPNAYQHPAKYAKGLIERIFDHLLSQGYVHKGDLVADCFGGVALGGIVAAYRGLRWVGVELEPRFVELSKANIERHRYKLGVMGKPIPEILQGDSRHFAELVSGACAAVTSPPYADSVNSEQSGIDWEKANRPDRAGGPPKSCHSQGVVPTAYGQTPGQIACLSDGKVASVVTSPPYESTKVGRDNADVEVEMKRIDRKLKSGAININHAKKFSIHSTCQLNHYGSEEGQIGNESKDDYWHAMRDVYASVWQSLKPGGVLVVVIKDYCRAGKRVPLCDDTLTLLEHLGFVPLERIRAMLVKETREQGLNGEEFVNKTERKSFFRRLHEAKMPADDERRINWEEVLIVRKPLCH